jgi:hypothetical protein
MAGLERVSISGRSPWRLGSLTVLSPSLLATIVASVQVSLGAPSELMTGFPDLPVARSTSQETYYERPNALLRTAQNTNGLTLSIAIDSKKNHDYVKADDTFSSFVYEALAQGDTIKFQPASKNVMGVWKGNGTIEDSSDLNFGPQVSPVFIVVQVRNDGTSAAQVTSAYLDVGLSTTDFQPFLEISFDHLGCMGSDYNPRFDLMNYGWGPVNNGRLVYRFGTNFARSSEFVADLGSFDDSRRATVEGGLVDLGVNVERLKAGKFKCASKSELPACFSRLKQTGILGNLADYAYTDDNEVLTKVIGNIQYDWTDNNKNSNHRVSPFRTLVPLFQFDVGTGAECGAAGPVDRLEKPVHLSLDRRNYRISLAWHRQIKPRQVSRFALSLDAEKSSHHVLRIVLVLADGNSLSSGPIDISYFTPRLSKLPADDSEEGK